MTTSFLKQLDARAQAIDSLLCVGLDPHAELLTEYNANAVRQFCFRLIDATADLACAFKPNAAFFEALGDDGYRALREVIAHVPAGIPVILDAKRGDIASTADAYAKSAFDNLGATAITLSPYLGGDSIAPFLKYPGKGAFVLCKTSNPGADEFQALSVKGESLYLEVARQSQEWNTADNLGLVVGATDLDALARVRKIAPETWFLVPGVGAQGGDLDEALRAGLRADGLGMLINVSRSIAKTADPRAEASLLRESINTVRREIRQSAASVNLSVDESISVLARALAEAGCVRFGQFTLKSGAISPIYLDLRRLVSFPSALHTVGEMLAHLLKGLEFDVMAGIPYAALPIATAASLIMGRPLIYPRRETKDYGTKAAIEGVFSPGDTAVLIDDLATTGETKFETIDRLKAAGLVVKDVVVVIDREQGAGETIRAAGYGFHSVITLRELVNVLERLGHLSPEQRREVDVYLAASTKPEN